MAAKKKKTPVTSKKKKTASPRKAARKAPARKKAPVARKPAVAAPAPPPPPPGATSEELQALAGDIRSRIEGLTEKLERIDARVDALATRPEPEPDPGASKPAGSALSRDALAPLAEPMAAFVRAYKEAHESRIQTESMAIWAYVVIVVLVLLVGVVSLVGGKLSSDAVAMVIGAVTVVGIGQVLRYFATRRAD